MKSFRLRIILWTSVIAGAVMLAFGIAGNLAFKHIKQGQVDDFLRIMVERAHPPPSHARYWNRFGPEAVKELQKRFGTEVFIAAYGREDVGEQAASELTVVSWGQFEELFLDRSALPRSEGSYDPFEDRPRGSPSGPGGFNGRERGFRMEQARPEMQFLSWVREGDGSHWRIAAVKLRGYNVLVGVNYETIREDTALMRNAFAIAFPVALAAMAACIWIFVTKAISPVRRLSDTIASVSAQSLAARVDSSGEYSEFASLIEHFNGMLERLERSFTQATRFSADAAHELKTPLAILQGQLEVALQQAEDRSDAQRLLGGLLEETHRLKSITRKLLILAKADAGTLEIQAERVDLAQLVEDVVELARDDEPEAKLRFEVSPSEQKLESLCDETLSRQILNNLVGNALKYRMPRESVVTVRLEAIGDMIAVEVANRCEPMDSDTRSRLFDRFIRGDAARNRAVDGAGLGLSLSLEFARAQGGQLSIVGDDPADLLRIQLQLPAYRGSRSAAD
ncbi:HAMP domain-containing protein [Pelagicoccus sp. NFK12]|uniref:histidine kinase n=1 Tax=Pelagicoccus enzymogenes TaxID=2773457 RepID=A0A927IF35_9BACT|nr:ATP-binding protein [Pelagicoccus enzymogenes]MBD5779697.1 HAMP domain-containing protein [Pelagicoccus enzymogenes]MDQ8199327.1 histidine kinase dimerization/phospho-acceptor domain-containing protein [Pelagicoccus enzymogenes]